MPKLTPDEARVLLPQFFREHHVSVHHPDGLHAVLPLPTPEEFCVFWNAGRLKDVTDWLKLREDIMEKMADRPLDHGYEPSTWAEVDALFEAEYEETELIACFGVNRGGKSFWAAKRLCEAARAYPGSTLLVGSETQDSSVETAQKIVWHYLRNCEGTLPDRPDRPLAIGPYNSEHKRDEIVKVNYTMANGFTEGKLVMANRTTILFATYNEDTAKYEGMEFGARVYEQARRKNGTIIQNVGYWLDEGAGLAWVEMLKRRSRYRAARGLWTYTPIRGLTPAMKEVLGTPRILQDRLAPLLPMAQVPGCRPGHMPRIAVAALPRTMAFWFHLGDNPFGGYTQSVAQGLQDKPIETVERLAYGYARESVARACPKFGDHNIVATVDLPERGSNYMVTDPGTKKPYFTIWVRVTENGDHWIYRDWPDEQHYGEWAVPTQRETSDESRKGWDGDPGPAQNSIGLGYAGYRALWLQLEGIPPIPEEVDPYRRRLQLEGGGVRVQEEILGRIIDTRAANREVQTNEGNTTPLIEFGKSELDPTTGQTIEPMMFRLAAADKIDAGLTLLNGFLDWAPGETRILGRPRLWVAAHCRQVIWALRNFTGRSGQDGASKDPIDCLRYMAAAALVYADPGQLSGRSGRGWK